MERTEFGAKRSVCGCKECIRNCHFIPGYLIPADLDRLIPKGEDPFAWAAMHLSASPGAILLDRKTRLTYRVPTLVPRTPHEGSMACHWLDSDNRCQVHENAPFGCAFFDCSSTPDASRDTLSKMGLFEIIKARIAEPPSLYRRLWLFLDENGFRSPSPEAKRAAMREAGL